MSRRDLFLTSNKLTSVPSIFFFLFSPSVLLGIYKLVLKGRVQK